MTVWRINVNTVQSVWMLSTAIPASVKRVSGERHGNSSDTNIVKLCGARLGGQCRWLFIIRHLTVSTH